MTNLIRYPIRAALWTRKSANEKDLECGVAWHPTTKRIVLVHNLAPNTIGRYIYEIAAELLADGWRVIKLEQEWYDDKVFGTQSVVPVQPVQSKELQSVPLQMYPTSHADGHVEDGGDSK